MTAMTPERTNSEHPVHITGTGRPNLLLIRDYAANGGARFRVETDIPLDQVEFKVVRSLLEDPNPVNQREMLNLLHTKVDKQATSAREKQNAKQMFSAAFAIAD